MSSATNSKAKKRPVDAAVDNSAPPAKKQRQSADGDAARNKPKTPFDKWQAKVNSAIESAGMKDCIWIRGPAERFADSDEEKEEPLDLKNSDLTAQDLSHVRVILMSEERDTQYENVKKMLLGDDYGDKFLMFNTSFSYGVSNAFDTFKRTYTSTRGWSKRFDYLCGFTFAVCEFDCWMHDNEDPEEFYGLAKDLVKKWRALFKKSDEELGIDTEFTRPGAECLVEQFKEKINGSLVEHTGLGDL